jgi:hypothetical protein
MKRCAIFFALLIITLVVAVLTEHRNNTLPMEDVTMESGNSMVRQDVGVVLPARRIIE